MSGQVIRWGAARAMAWKNGGGVTHEVAVHPEGAALGAFDWRISMAEVATDGPFSSFEGIDRTLCLMDGAGLVLRVAGDESVIDAEAAPFAFAGEAPVDSRLINGPILDLNVMTRRAAMRHRVSRIEVHGAVDLSGSCLTAIVCHSGSVRVDGPGITLGPRDSLLVGAAGPAPRLIGEGTVFAVVIEAV